MFSNRMMGTTLLLVFSLLLAACSRTIVAREIPPTIVIKPDEQDGSHEAWLKALQETGADVAATGEVTQPFFSTTGQVIGVNGQEVQLFIYGDETTAKAEAELVSPEGTAVGTSIMMWMASPHFYHSGNTIALYLGDDASTLATLEEVFGPQFAGAQAAAGSDDIAEAALAGLEAIGWDINGFTAEIAAVEGDYARVTITTTNPPGGFSAFMMRQDGNWTVAAHGSAYNPDELKAVGFPTNIFP